MPVANQWLHACIMGRMVFQFLRPLGYHPLHVPRVCQYAVSHVLHNRQATSIACLLLLLLLQVCWCWTV
jgi:hypothetical protein